MITNLSEIESSQRTITIFKILVDRSYQSNNLFMFVPQTISCKLKTA